jgi:hypothetical protein
VLPSGEEIATDLSDNGAAYVAVSIRTPPPGRAARSVDAIIAATGFTTGLESLIDVPGVLNDLGEPRGTSGEPTAHAGLYFVGFTHSLRGHLFEANRASCRLARNVERYLTSHGSLPSARALQGRGGRFVPDGSNGAPSSHLSDGLAIARAIGGVWTSAQSRIGALAHWREESASPPRSTSSRPDRGQSHPTPRSGCVAPAGPPASPGTATPRRT